MLCCVMVGIAKEQDFADKGTVGQTSIFCQSSPCRLVIELGVEPVSPELQSSTLVGNIVAQKCRLLLMLLNVDTQNNYSRVFWRYSRVEMK